ncbi:KilA-N domain-containing protein [Pseudomonas sp. S9]|uniref:KilA-N domain-containing protein n=1 Tax=Pseudomonas sp. S9 TaxID=686578 RepID=UPI0009FE1A24
MKQPQDDKVVVIDGWVVQQDAEGRYCLNDLHRAAGGSEQTKVWRWKSLGETAELITELKHGYPCFEPLTSKKGRYGGTYAVKELVYAYAMWMVVTVVSPAEYHLKAVKVLLRTPESYGCLGSADGALSGC